MYGSPRTTYSPHYDNYGNPTRGVGASQASPTRGVRFVFENAPAGSPNPHQSPFHNSPRYHDGGEWDMMPVDSSVPMIKESEDASVPDFVALMREANTQSGMIARVRYRPNLGWDDVSAKLERPRGLHLEVDADGGEELGREEGEEEEGEGEREVEAMRVRLDGSRLYDDFLEDEGDGSSSDDEEEEGGMKQDEDGTGVESLAAGEGEEGEEEEKEEAVEDTRFHPLSQESFADKINWGTGVASDDDEDSENEAQMMQVSGGGDGEEGEIEEDHVLAARRDAWRRVKEEERRREASLTSKDVENDVAAVLGMPVPLNEELASGRWMDLIIWKGRSLPPTSRPHYYNRLIVDANDPDLFPQPPRLPKADLKALGLVSSLDVKPVEAVVARRTITIPTIEHAECALKHEVTLGQRHTPFSFPCTLGPSST